MLLNGVDKASFVLQKDKTLSNRGSLRQEFSIAPRDKASLQEDYVVEDLFPGSNKGSVIIKEDVRNKYPSEMMGPEDLSLSKKQVHGISEPRDPTTLLGHIEALQEELRRNMDKFVENMKAIRQ